MKIYWAQVRAWRGGLMVTERYHFPSEFWRDDFRLAIRVSAGKLGELDGFGETDASHTANTALAAWTEALEQ